MIPIKMNKEGAIMDINSKVIYIAAGLLVNERKVLIALKKDGKWEFPGGKLDNDESYEKAVVREFKEELSVTVTPLEELGAVEVDRDDNTVIIISFILVKSEAASVVLKEHSDYKFVSFEELDSFDLIEPDRIFVKENEAVLRKII